MLQTLLCLAVIFNQPAIVEALLKSGADVNVQIKRIQSDTMKFDNAIHFCANRGHFWIKTLTVLLRSAEVDINLFNSEGEFK